jgi:polysaccharide biosynthesis/export protein
VMFWRDQEMSGDVTVRPDGMITLPLLRDIRAAGLTPDVLRSQIQQAAGKYIADPNVTVVVRQINSRKVFITGQVARPGPYPMPTPMTVMQLIAVAGGLLEFAGKNLDQNITLRPGDTVVVP